MKKSNSLENINLQFRTIMGNMGLDEEKQNKLTMKLDISRKIKTIISMQTLDERKKKIGEFLERIETSNSLMCLLSLHCSIDNGSKSLFSIFMTQKGPQVLLKTIKEMEGDYAHAVVDFIFMLLQKYDCEIPFLFETLFRRVVEIRLNTPTLDKLYVHFIEKKEYEAFFKSNTPYDCVCSTFLFQLVRDLNGDEPDWIKKLKETDRKEYVEYVLSLKNGKEKEVVLKKGCKSERLFENIRIGEEKKLLDIMTSLLEGIVLGTSKVKFVEQAKVIETKLEDLKLSVPNKSEPIMTPVPSPVTNTPIPPPEEKPKKKPLKKFIKKTKPDKNYMQLEWTKIEKQGTIFESLRPVEIPIEELEPFEKKEIKIDVKRPIIGLPKKECVFSDKKNYALDIALSRVKLSDCELRDQILILSSKCDLNLVKQLLFYFPTGEEVKLLSTLERDPIGRGESFFKECVPVIHKVSDSLYTLNFKHLLNSLDIMDNLTIFSQYYQALLSSPTLNLLISTLLALGNALNKGTPLGEAEAFSFNSIPKILENKNVVDFLKRKLDIPQFLLEFQIIRDIQRLSFETLNADYNELVLTSQKIEFMPFDLEDKFKGVKKRFNEVLALQNKAKAYFNEKINEEFNRNLYRIYERFSEG